MTEEATGWGGQLWAAADLVTPMAIRVAATLRLADHIAAGRQTAEALAAVVDADRDALGRLLGHLVTAGVLTRAGSDTYDLTALGEQLRDDDPAGLRPWLDLEGAIGRADLCFVELLHTVRTGEPAFPRRFGASYWDDLSADEDLAASFDALMGSRLKADGPAVAAAYPWGALGHVVDVGGGDASLLIAILHAHGDLRGTVVDLPGPVARAGEAIAAAGLTDRADARAGSFFDALPAAAGGYILSGILHDWDDEPAVRILRRCADAASAEGRCSSWTTSSMDATTPTPKATCGCSATSAAGNAPSTSSATSPVRPASRSVRSRRPAPAPSSSCGRRPERQTGGGARPPRSVPGGSAFCLLFARHPVAQPRRPAVRLVEPGRVRLLGGGEPRAGAVQDAPVDERRPCLQAERARDGVEPQTGARPAGCSAGQVVRVADVRVPIGLQQRRASIGRAAGAGVEPQREQVHPGGPQRRLHDRPPDRIRPAGPQPVAAVTVPRLVRHAHTVGVARPPGHRDSAGRLVGFGPWM